MENENTKIKIFNDIKEVERHMIISKAKAIFIGVIAFFTTWFILSLLNHPIAGFFVAFVVAGLVYISLKTSFIYEELLPFDIEISPEVMGKIAATLSGITKINYRVNENTGEIYGPLKIELSKISAQTIGTGVGVGYGANLGIGIGSGVAHTSGEIKPSKEEIGRTNILIEKGNRGVTIRAFFEISSRYGGTGADVVENVISILKSILAQQSK